MHFCVATNWAGGGSRKRERGNIPSDATRRDKFTSIDFARRSTTNYTHFPDTSLLSRRE